MLEESIYLIFNIIQILLVLACLAFGGLCIAERREFKKFSDRPRFTTADTVIKKTYVNLDNDGDEQYKHSKQP
jgi:hypothetical protein